VFSSAAAISAAGSLPSSGDRRWRRTAGKRAWTWSGYGDSKPPPQSEVRMTLVVAENQESNLPVDDFEEKVVGKRPQGSTPQTADDEMEPFWIPDHFQTGLFRLRKEAVTQLRTSFFVVEHQRRTNIFLNPAMDDEVHRVSVRERS
jgi:hypothetical protein